MEWKNNRKILLNPKPDVKNLTSQVNFVLCSLDKEHWFWKGMAILQVKVTIFPKTSCFWNFNCLSIRGVFLE